MRASLVAQSVKNLPAVQEIWVRSLDWEDPLEREMAIHSSILAWKISWTEEPGGLQSMGSQRIGHDWATNTNTNTHSLILCKEPCSERPYEAGPSVTHLKPMVETWSCESHLQRACRPRDRESDFITDWVSEPSSPVSPSVNWGIGLNNLSMSCQQL